MPFSPLLTSLAVVATVGASALAWKKKKASEPMTFEEFLKIDSKKNDNYIILKSAELKMKYVKGLCTITRENENMVHSSSLFYFTDDKDEYREVNLTFDIPIKDFSDDEETLNKLEELIQNPMSFEIVQ